LTHLTDRFHSLLIEITPHSMEAVMYEKLRAAAEKNWATWAAGLADGGAPPPPLELLEAGGLLGIERPADALEKDANAIREVRDLEQRAAGLRERAKTERAPHGTQAERRARIVALRAEIKKLENLAGVHPWDLHAGQLLGQADRIRSKHPHAFRPSPPAPTGKRPRRKAVTA
jgi:hypothetical protein